VEREAGRGGGSWKAEGISQFLVNRRGIKVMSAKRAVADLFCEKKRLISGIVGPYVG